MKRTLAPFLLWAGLLMSLSCSALAGSPVEKTESPLKTEEMESSLRADKTAPILEPKKTESPLRLEEIEDFYDAVEAQDDLSIIRYIDSELDRADLETPYSPYDICYEETVREIESGAGGKPAAEPVEGCGSAEDGDYAMAASVSLESSAATAACGYRFRSDGEGDWYALRLERTEGAAFWSLLRFAGGVVAEVLIEPAADGELILADGARTRVLLYARGETLKVFFNGRLAGTVTDSGLTAGTISLFAEAESGTAMCRYDAVWVNVYH
ncbi:MAG: hypothetical protein JW929_13405 [Anaerolineales bacterium]|nr:hypothetical protein [Anaerolineales bacterium]